MCNWDKLANNKCLLEITLCLKLTDIAHTLISEDIIRNTHEPLITDHIINLALLHLAEKDA